ncbi:MULTISPECIES: hypothetical protein [unclassified Stenotrophomonas]|uniref:hypothetical protein n=1 Tax=unclassified Stenotrophomonas TaxID=196198 RepID=UPI00211783F0|nr:MULTISPECIES: hypothetical protein [unclassified Stenotrophomonas]
MPLAYVIRREDDGLRYAFAVPLFATRFQREAACTLQQREPQGLTAALTWESSESLSGRV